METKAPARDSRHATRNGLRMRENLYSFTKSLGRRGYETAAFLGNWTLRDKLSGMREHFETYEVLLTRKRWFGLLKRGAALTYPYAKDTVGGD